MPRALFLTLVAGFGSLALHAQAPADTPQAPTFRSSVELVQLDVSVLDDDRRPITGLAAADFTVSEDGRARPIVSFAAVQLPEAPVANAAWTRDVAPDVASNAPLAGGRLVVILLDRSVPPGQPTLAARAIAKAAVEALGANDQAAVIFTGFGVPQNFTADRARLLRAIERAEPSTEGADGDLLESTQAVETQNAQSNAGAMQAGQCYCGLCVPETITHVADTVREIPRRKSLLFIGSTVTLQSGDPDCGFRLRDATDKMIRALDRANVTVHSFDPGGLENNTYLGRASAPGIGGRGRTPGGMAATQLANQNSLSVLPSRTGGRVVKNSNTPERDVRAVFDETRAYYLLAFESAATEPGKARDVRVRTSRRGAHVYAQRQYQPAGEPSTGPIGSEVARALTRATTGMRPTSDIPLAVSAVPLAVPGSSEAEVIVVVGMRYPLVAQPGIGIAGQAGTVREQVAILASAYDRYANPRAFDERAVAFSRPAAASGVAPLDAFARVGLKPGSYELRVAVSSADGVPSGSVFTYVDVPSFRKARLSLSGLMLESDPGTPSVVGDAIDGQLPVTPTARRTFAPADRVTAFLRVYQGGATPIQPVDVTLRMTTALGVVALDRHVVLATDAFGADRSADLRSVLPLTILEPGEHLLTVDARLGDVTQTEQLRFTVAGSPPPGMPRPVVMGRVTGTDTRGPSLR